MRVLPLIVMGFFLVTVAFGMVALKEYNADQIKAKESVEKKSCPCCAECDCDKCKTR